MKKCIYVTGIAVFMAAAAVYVQATPNGGGGLTGAIFTTLPDGSRVNYNIYSAKPLVYLDGGPGDKAPITAAGLPDGTYVFQVTDPSGKTLLSVDEARCREFTVKGGIITGAVATADHCEHWTGVDQDHGAQGAVTIQLCGGGLASQGQQPTACFLDTPNPGGVYKVWVTQIGNFPSNCLNVVDCGPKKQGTAHGFTPKYSKTDNFKVKGLPREIDGRAHGKDGTILDGWRVIWTDTLGGSNIKYSYEDLSLDVHHEAHVEDVEDGTHQFTLTDQSICTIGQVAVDGVVRPLEGPQTLTINVTPDFTGGTIFYDVYCK